MQSNFMRNRVLENVHAFDVNSLRVVSKLNNYLELDSFVRIIILSFMINAEKGPILRRLLYDLL